MMDFMSILVKRILKTHLKIYDGFSVMMDFPYELFVLVKRSLVANCSKFVFSTTACSTLPSGTVNILQDLTRLPSTTKGPDGTLARKPLH